jgi:hypothetical protein
LVSYIIVHRIYQKNEAKKRILKINPGGVDVSNCFQEFESVYEIVDPNLIKIIRYMLNKPYGPSVAILGFYLLQKPSFAIRFLGLELMTNNLLQSITSLVLPALIGILAGGSSSWIFSSLIGATSPVAIILAVTLGVGGFHQTTKILESKICQQIVRILPTVSVDLNENEKVRLDYIETEITNSNSQRTFIKEMLEKPIYQRKQVPSDCQTISNQPLTLADLDLTKPPTIRQKCKVKNEYIPLKHRTKTLNDLKRYDDTEFRDIDSYQTKAEKFRAKRIRIQENRNYD